jgi:hypothetical protein
VKAQFIALLKKDESNICDAWRYRLSETALLAGSQLTDRPSNPIRPLLRDLVRMLEGEPLAASNLPGIKGLYEEKPVSAWRISLCQCVEVFLTGEVVIRSWTRTHLDATDGEFLELFELLNRATHELLRFYTLRYCENCRAGLPEPSD